MSVKLRFVFFEKLAAYLLVGRERDFRALAQKHLSGFLPREGENYIFSPENLASLEKALSELRSLFARDLGEAPLPFSLVPEGTKVRWIRPGKLYVPPSLKEEISSQAEKLDFLVQTNSWRDLLEIILPSTSDPELLFRARDLLWVGREDLCFYCGLPWHPNARCPGLQEVVPGRALREYMDSPLEELGPKITEKIWEAQLTHSDLQGLYGRYFYFLPAFLRVLFYKVPEWSHFSQVGIGMEIAGRGGHLLIALESLQHGDFQEAEKRFLAAGPLSDYKVAFGLSQLAISQEDYERALYYLEELHPETLPPLVQAYLFLLKGRIYEIRGDLVSAESFYAEALRRDHSMVPASYHKLRIAYSLGSIERETGKLSPYLGHPMVFIQAFLDPIFIRAARELEKDLLNRVEKKQAEALARLREAEDGLHRLKHILSEEERSSLEDRISHLRERIYRGSFFELERVSLQASELALEIQGYTYRKIRDLKEKLTECFTRYQDLRRYWARYPYREGETAFEYRLREVGERLVRLEQRLGKDPLRDFRLILKESQNIERALEVLEEEKERLETKALFRRQLARFLKVFLLGEILLFLLYFSLPSFTAAIAPELLPYLPFSFSSFLGFSFLLFVGTLIWVLLRR